MTPALAILYPLAIAGLFVALCRSMSQRDSYRDRALKVERRLRGQVVGQNWRMQ